MTTLVVLVLRYVVERRSGTAWVFIGAHQTQGQWTRHIEHLYGRGWAVRVVCEGHGDVSTIVDLKPGDTWEGRVWR